MFGDKFLNRSVTIVRLLLSVQYLLSGFNWWVKILPFPSVNDPPAPFYKSPIMPAMIEMGWMMPLVKSIEIATGLALLFDLFVPLMLVVSFPVAFMTFLLDAFILQYVWGWLTGSVSSAVMIAHVLDMVYFGGVVVLMQGYLMLAYLPKHYVGLFARKGVVSEL